MVKAYQKLVLWAYGGRFEICKMPFALETGRIKSHKGCHWPLKRLKKKKPRDIFHRY